MDANQLRAACITTRKGDKMLAATRANKSDIAAGSLIRGSLNPRRITWLTETGSLPVICEILVSHRTVSIQIHNRATAVRPIADGRQ